MKKITLTFFLLLFEIGFSQNAPISFELGENGSTWSFASFENGGGLGYEKVVNPFRIGINTSGTVSKFTALTTAAGAAPYAGCESAHSSGINGIGAFTFSLSNCIVKVMVYKPIISDVGIKFAESNGEAQAEVKVKNTKINEWEELTFDMSGSIGKGITGIIDQIIIFPDFQARTTENVCYFDNITFSAKSGTTTSTGGPTTAAPTPAVRNGIDVKSVFSGAYTDIAGTSWNDNWGQSTVSEEVSIAGDATKKLSNLNYQGVVPAAGIDASGMTQLHLDIWTADCTAFEVYLINPGPIEQKVTLIPTLSGWNSFDINLSDFSNIALNNVFQFKFVSPSQNSTVYLDNMYFYKAVTTGGGATSTAPTLPLDFESSTIAYSFVDFDGGAVTKIANPHNTGINTSATVAQMVKGTGQPWAGSKIVMASPVDFNTKKLFKIKVWSPVAGKKLLLKFEGAGAAFEKESTGVTTANAWEELSFDFTAVAGINNLNDNMVFIFDLGTAGDGSGNSTYLFDDISQTTVSVGTGTSLTQMSLPTTFDDATVEYDLIGFGGAEASTVVVDPTLSTNKVAKVVKSATAELWAGTTITAAAGLGFSSAIPFTATATKMNVRVWSPTAGIPVRLKVEDHNDVTHTVETEATVTIASGWQTLEFNFANQASGTATLNLAFVYDKASIFFNFGTTGAVSGEKTYYFDDVAFGAAAAVAVLVPTVAAPTPPVRLMADVMSMFSGAYADIAGISWTEDWGQTTLSEEVAIAGNPTKKYSNLNYQGVVPSVAIDATGMTQLHLDIWTPDCTAFEVYLINPGPVEQKVILTPSLAGWNSFDINLSDFSGISLNTIFQIKFVSPNENSTIYLDNFYFYRPAVVGPITMAPTNLNYGGNLRFEINKDVKSVTPTVTADPLPTYNISPDMPKGMSFDTVSGSIVGKPTVENVPVSYTVTATNSVGSQKLTFTIEIFNNDHDFDGINDDVDNCPEFYNPNQEDKNNDGIGDVCTQEEQVKVAQGFSPNGDGINDTWFIKNIENYPNTQVRVFNKTGAEVFFSRDYKNLWDGTYKNTGKTVAAGSYFYQVDLSGDSSIDLQGWIYIAN